LALVVGTGIVILNVASASGPVYGAAGAVLETGAEGVSALLCEPPPPHAARETDATVASTEMKDFWRSSRFMGTIPQPQAG
jgi:hypothetical protein